MRTSLRYVTPVLAAAGAASAILAAHAAAADPTDPTLPQCDKRWRRPSGWHRDDGMRDARQCSNQCHRPRRARISLSVGRRVLRTRADHGGRQLGPTAAVAEATGSHIIPWPI